jgi:hypothetical protein
MSKVCVPGGQVPLRTLLLTSKYPADQRKRGFQSVGYRAISSSNARHNVTYSLEPASRLRAHVRIRAFAAQEPEALPGLSCGGGLGIPTSLIERGWRHGIREPGLAFPEHRLGG